MTFAAAAAFFSWPRLAPSSAAGAAPEPQRRRAAPQRRNPARGARPRVDYTRFTHSTAAHRKDSCDSCHKSPSDNWLRVRPREAAFPDITDFPEHESCLGCHRQQFFQGARPAICAVCHTVVSPRAGDRHPFANPPEQFVGSARAKARPGEFAVHFPHDLHQDVMARTPADGAFAPRFVRASFAQDAPKKAKPDGCSICHQTVLLRAGQPTPTPAAADAQPAAAPTPPPDGLLKTTPTGHASCFNCHWQDGGEKPYSNDCAGCHRPAPQAKEPAARAGGDGDAQFAARAGFADPLHVRKLMRRDSALFSHEVGSHKPLDCTYCHVNITSLSVVDERTLKVPILTCGGSGCHIDPRTKKWLDQEVAQKASDPNFRCVKCHVNLGTQKAPQSHLAAAGVAGK
ncbi:MAG TPA: hypothetical protein VF659_23485 [Pyrinomonadaceae bacterium]